jgi:hypothetical protein
MNKRPKKKEWNFDKKSKINFIKKRIRHTFFEDVYTMTVIIIL